MNQPALTASDVLAWLETTSTKWRALIEAHPEVLALPCDVMGVTTVAGLLQHIVAVELRYADQLRGHPPTDYSAIPFDSAAAIYATHERAMQAFRELVASTVDWDERIEFATRSAGRARAKRKTILFHASLHAIRHYAQLATLVRQHGFKPDWPMDYLFMDMERVGDAR
ncbi:MAG TPA: DinB family protein [Gemmatimonadaceae bacterium]|nr:DinB family protein [Gemmatimonadaceae bacterium]